MRVTVKLFGPAAQRAGMREVGVAVDSARVTCAELKKALARAAPSIANLLPASRFAVNQEFAADDDPVSDKDEVALIAMVSGG
jgi:molybdopterin synthase sulfur carrier subunit